MIMYEHKQITANLKRLKLTRQEKKKIFQFTLFEYSLHES